MALYPTQRETWDRLQGEVDYGKRTRCGRPGVNGGYFDPATKFGVNCFGIKPRGDFTPPAPVPGIDNKRFSEMVNRFKEMIKSFTLNPYSRMEWSEYDNGMVKETFTPGTNSFFSRLQQDFFTPYGVREHLEGGSQDYVEPVGETGLGVGASPLRGPIGLLGDIGPTGATGGKGDKGDQGSQGPGGPGGPPGNVGPQGGPGPTGPQGVPGQDGKSEGVVGPTGKAGKDGVQGATGPRGPSGLVGPAGAAAVIPKDLSVDRLNIGNMRIENAGGNLHIYRPDNPNPNRKIMLWANGDHTSIMTTRSNGTQNWFGY